MMEDYKLIIKAREWINSLNGTRFQIYDEFSEEELIQIGKNRIKLEKINK